MEVMEARYLQINFGGFITLSTVDWPGLASAVIFFRGCPLRCPFCHNKDIQGGQDMRDLSTVKKEVKKAITFGCFEPSDQITLDEAAYRVVAERGISALVFSGGEALAQPEAVRSLALFCKSIGIKAGLETCGYYSDHLRQILPLVDKIFLDVKAALKEPEHFRATGVEGASSRVRDSLEICMASGVPLEVRTTVFPGMPSAQEIREIAELLSSLQIKFPDNALEGLVLQQGLPRSSEFEPLTADDLKAIATSVEGLVRVQTRARKAPDKVLNPGSF